MSDAARLRAQIPTSTDPERLEVLAREVEVWNRAIEEVAKVLEPEGEQPCPGCDYRGSGCDCPQGGEAVAWDARKAMADRVRRLKR